MIFPIKITNGEKLFHKLKSGISKRNNSKKHPIRKPKKNGIKMIIEDDVKNLTGTVIIDPNKLNAKIFTALNKEVSVIREVNITTNLKAIKNEVEIANWETSQVRDGIAMVRFIKWLTCCNDLFVSIWLSLICKKVANRPINIRNWSIFIFDKSFCKLSVINAIRIPPF